MIVSHNRIWPVPTKPRQHQSQNRLVDTINDKHEWQMEATGWHLNACWKRKGVVNCQTDQPRRSVWARECKLGADLNHMNLFYQFSRLHFDCSNQINGAARRNSFKFIYMIHKIGWNSGNSSAGREPKVMQSSSDRDTINIIREIWFQAV